MRWAKFAAVVSLWAFFFALIAFVHLWISLLQLPNRWTIISRLTYSFTFLLRTLLNLDVKIDGDTEPMLARGRVIIANHFSYLDGIVLGSIFPTVFVWAAICGTIFIDRQRKYQVRSLVLEMSKRLNQGANILLFPEGRATNGERILPFQTAPLAAPLRNHAIIVPITLRYTCLDDTPVSKENRDWIYCYDDMDFVPHFWKLLSLRRIEVVVTIRRKIDCSRYEDSSAGRKQLALDCYRRVVGEIVESANTERRRSS